MKSVPIQIAWSTIWTSGLMMVMGRPPIPDGMFKAIPLSRASLTAFWMTSLPKLPETVKIDIPVNGGQALRKSKLLYT